MTSVQFQDVEKEFVPGKTSVTIDRLLVESAAFVAIVGPSGCGKSTLLRMVAELDSPTRGKVVLKGLRESPERAFVFQDANLIPWRTAWENVRLPLELRGRVSSANRESIDAALRLVGLRDEDFQKFPRMLSGGMRMRVSLARALVTQPAVLLLDEPFAALDDLLRNQLNEQLLDFWQRQRWTALFVTHNIPEAVFLSQRIIVMQSNPGRIVAQIDVPFAYPRSPSLRSEPAFAEFCGRVMQQLESGAAA